MFPSWLSLLLTPTSGMFPGWLRRAETQRRSPMSVNHLLLSKNYLLFVYLIFIGVLPACISVCLVPAESRRRHWLPGASSFLIDLRLRESWDKYPLHVSSGCWGLLLYFLSSFSFPLLRQEHSKCFKAWVNEWLSDGVSRVIQDRAGHRSD